MHGHTTTIRHLGPEDAHVLDRVRPGLFDETTDPQRAWAFLATRTNDLVVAIEAGEVVALAAGTLVLNPVKPTTYLVTDLTVHADLRRRGVAARLLRRLAALGRDRGAETVRLVAGDDGAGTAFAEALEGRRMAGLAVFEWGQEGLD